MELITDRTSWDLNLLKRMQARGWDKLNLKEKQMFLAGMKGAYNYTDFNRVERAVAELSARMDVQLETKTDWKLTDVPTYADQERYLGNISTLLRKSGSLTNTPEVPRTLSGLTYKQANDIEQILLDIEAVMNTQFVCGTVYCGEE